MVIVTIPCIIAVVIVVIITSAFVVIVTTVVPSIRRNHKHTLITKRVMES